MLEQINVVESPQVSKREGLPWEKWQEAERWMGYTDYLKVQQVEALVKYLEIIGKTPKIADSDQLDIQQVRTMIDRMWSDDKSDQDFNKLYQDFNDFYTEYNEKLDPETSLTHRCRFRRDNMMYRKDLPVEKIESFYTDKEWEKIN